MLKRSTVEQICQNTIQEHKSSFVTRKEKWDDLLSKYRNELRKGSITADTESKIRLGSAYSMVENALPRLLSRQPRFSYLARERNDANSAELYKEFTDYQWDESESQQELKDICKKGLIYGMVGWKIGWKEERKIVKKRTKEIMGIEIKNALLQKIASTKLKDKEEVVSNYTLDAIKPHKLVWNTNAKRYKDVRVLGYCESRYILDLKADGFDTRNLVAQIKRSEDFGEDISYAQKQSLIETSQVDVFEMYTKIKNSEGYFEYHMVTLASYGEGVPVVLDFRENPFNEKFIPIGVWRPITNEGKFYGYGVIEPSEGLIEGEEDSLNMVLEAFWTDVSKPMEYNPNNVLNIKALEYRPRTLIPVRQLGQSVAPMNTPRPDVGAFTALQDYLYRAKQNTSGITDFQTGADQVKGAKTLGEIQIKTQESATRLMMMLDSFEKEVLEPMGKMVLYMNQQYLASNKKLVFRILGKKGKMSEKEINFKDIEAIKDLKIIGGSSALVVQQAELQKWSLLLNQASGELSLGPNGVPINREYIWERLLEDGLMIKDTENFLPSVKERESDDVNNKLSQIQDVKSENANPISARVLPSDDPEVHIKLHQAEIQQRQKELMMAEQQGIEVPPDRVDELQILMSHLDAHVAQSGGLNPSMQPNANPQPNPGLPGGQSQPR